MSLNMFFRIIFIYILYNAGIFSITWVENYSILMVKIDFLGDVRNQSRKLPVHFAYSHGVYMMST